MSYCTYIDPKTGKRAIGSLDENGSCSLNQHSRLEKFFNDPHSLQLFKTDPALHKAAPDFFIPEIDELAPFDRLFSTQAKPLDTAPTKDSVTLDLFDNLTCVLETFEADAFPEDLLPEGVTHNFTGGEKTNVSNLEKLDHKNSNHEILEQDILELGAWDKMDEVVRALRKHFKVMIPFLPQLSRVLSPRKSLYFLHMLWYIREYMDPQTGIAKFRSKYMSYYMSMSPRTENRLRDFFIAENVFECTYDRKTHLLHMNVNWDGLNAFLTHLDPKLVVLSQKPHNVKKKEDLSPESQNQSQRQSQIIKPKEPFEMTKEHRGCFKWFDSYIHKDPKVLSPSQVMSAVKDLGKVRLFSSRETAGGFRYILYDNDHALKPYLNAAGMDAFFVLEALTQTHPNLIPAIRPLSDCPDYYYKGEELPQNSSPNTPQNRNWRPREKVTYAFTKSIAHLMGFESYATLAGHMSIVEWNQNSLLKDETTIPEFLIATRNGPMAAILGVFFTHLMHRFKDNFRFHIVPLETTGMLST